MRIVTCLTEMHDPWLLALSVIFCLFGAKVTAGLLARHLAADQVAGPWLFLSGGAAGATTWCTHFIAMLAFSPTSAATFAPAVTALSLAVACLGATAAFALAHGRRPAGMAATGVLLGLSIAAMHYVGMAGYVYSGIMEWDAPHVFASVVFAAGFGAGTMLAMHASMRHLATLLLVLAIAGLHFTGMGALDLGPADPSWPRANVALIALSIAAVGATVIGSTFAASVVDTRNLRQTAESMRKMALTDTLTGLPNRVHFAQRLQEETARAAQTGGRLMVIGIDLDHFKEINDLRGHASGDEALRATARRMQAALLPGEFIARLGGDEFAAFRHVPEGCEPSEMPQRLREAILPPITLPDGGEAVVDGCFGVSLYPDDGTEAETLVGNADLAMYRAKAHPTDNVVFYAPEMDEAVRNRRALVADLRLALAQDQFELHYQVQESIVTKQVTGHEALLRWRHPQRGLVSPMEFIPAAEETGMILPIGEWVLRRACADAAARPGLGRVAVNLSAVQFSHPDLPGLVGSVLAETGLDPSRLEIELTESTLMEDAERNLAILRRIQGSGVSIAMDDFGTGYSSLSTLRSFHFDKIKMDRSFMSEVECDPQAKAIIRAVLALGSSLDIPVLAEGVETEDQLAFLQAEGCTEAQGYLLGRPAKLAAETEKRREAA